MNDATEEEPEDDELEDNDGCEHHWVWLRGEDPALYRCSRCKLEVLV